MKEPKENNSISSLDNTTDASKQYQEQGLMVIHLDDETAATASQLSSVARRNELLMHYSWDALPAVTMA